MSSITVFHYAVKVVCGTTEGAKTKVVAPGEYWTAINVHNPSGKTITFKKKLVIALPGEKPGPVGKPFEAKLNADEALEIDRDDIFYVLGKGLTEDKFIKGYVLLVSRVELDVVAVYTAGKDFVRTMCIERVPPRKVAVRPPIAK
jgi:hypothetical protein